MALSCFRHPGLLGVVQDLENAIEPEYAFGSYIKFRKDYRSLGGRLMLPLKTFFTLAEILLAEAHISCNKGA